MSLDTQEIDNLTKSCIDLILWNVNTLCSSESKSTDCRYFIDSIDWKDFVYKSRLLQSCQQFLQWSSLVMHLLLRILLYVEQLLELIKLLPKLSLIFFDGFSMAFKVCNLCKLFFLLCIDKFELAIKFNQLSFKSFALFWLFFSVFPFDLCLFQSQVLL